MPKYHEHEQIYNRLSTGIYQSTSWACYQHLLYKSLTYSFTNKLNPYLFHFSFQSISVKQYQMQCKNTVIPSCLIILLARLQ